MTLVRNSRRCELPGFRWGAATRASPDLVSDRDTHIYPSKSLKNVAFSFDHEPILFSTANPADKVFGRHRTAPPIPSGYDFRKGQVIAHIRSLASRHDYGFTDELFLIR